MQLNNAVEIGDFCRKEYIYWPLSSNKRLVFDRVIRHVNGGDVLDLGCGEAGLYWTMGYAGKVDRIDFLDRDAEAISSLKQQLEKWSPDHMDEHFSDTLAFIGADDRETLAMDILEKTGSFLQDDFCNLPANAAYDTILCVESLHVADTQAGLNNSVLALSRHLKQSGRIMGISWMYDTLDDSTKALIGFGSFGALNPGETEFGEAFSNAGMTARIETVFTPEIHNFSKAVIFEAAISGAAHD